MSDSLSSIRTRNTQTSQRQPVLGRDDQVQNHDGGYVFEAGDEARVMRFLTLGTGGGTYYQKEAEYTLENAQFIIGYARDHGVKLAYRILDVSEAGRAPRQKPALFALACVFAFGDDEAKKSAGEVFNRVVRTGYHLKVTVKYGENLRGWGRAFKRAVANWYLAKDVNDLSYQLIKYRSREDWTDRDVLRMAHPATTDTEKNALLRWASNPKRDTGLYYADGRCTYPGWTAPFEVVQGFAKLSATGSKSAYADVIRAHPGLPWEALPDVALSYPETWEALLDAGMPMTALIRSMPRLTRLGVLKGRYLAKVTDQLTNPEHLKAARVHPVQLLYALKIYAQGHGEKGRSRWEPLQAVVDAFDAGFYASFGTIEPAGKRTLLAVDCSDSMTWRENMCGVLQAREAAAAMAMATLASEPGCEVVGFSCGSGATLYDTYSYYRTGIERLPLSHRRRLDDNIRTVGSVRAGGTDCALPMTWARENSLEFDTIIVYTDNETNTAGSVHPFEALQQYRKVTGINAKLAVVAMSSTGFTIADSKDPGMLDVAGFDSDTPQVISGFSRGDFS